MKKTITLKKNYEFKNVLLKGKCYFGSFISIYIIKEEAALNRIGIAVGKKVANAVKRNQIKRWIRECYRAYESDFKYNYKMVFIIKKNVKIEDLDYWKIKNDMDTIFKKAGII